MDIRREGAIPLCWVGSNPCLEVCIYMNGKREESSNKMMIRGRLSDKILSMNDSRISGFLPERFQCELNWQL